VRHSPPFGAAADGDGDRELCGFEIRACLPMAGAIHASAAAGRRVRARSARANELPRPLKEGSLEVREAAVVDAVQRRPKLRDEIYFEKVKRKSS
jgi:hypothetical protein